MFLWFVPRTAFRKEAARGWAWHTYICKSSIYIQTKHKLQKIWVVFCNYKRKDPCKTMRELEAKIKRPKIWHDIYVVSPSNIHVAFMARERRKHHIKYNYIPLHFQPISEQYLYLAEESICRFNNREIKTKQISTICTVQLSHVTLMITTAMYTSQWDIVVVPNQQLQYHHRKVMLIINSYSVLFERSHFRISPTNTKVRTTLYSIINSNTEKYCFAAFIWIVTL